MAISQLSYTGGGKQSYTASGTFTVPPNVTTVYVSAVGGGGGGSSTGGGGYGGGGSGAISIKKPVTVTPGQNIAITIGAAGAAGAAGGITSFGALLSLSGGGPGASSNGGLAGGPGGVDGHKATTTVSDYAPGGSTPFGFGTGGHGYFAGVKGFLLVEW